MSAKSLGYALVAVLANVAVALPGFAWENDQLAILEGYNTPSADLKSEEGNVGLTSVNAAGALPLPLAESTYLVLGAGYNGLFTDYGDMHFPEADDLPHSFHAVSLAVGVNTEFSSAWGAYLAFMPAIHSDMKDVGWEDVYYMGGVLLSWQVAEDLKLYGGLYYADSFGEEMLLPALGGEWDLGDGFSLDTVLPQYLIFSWEAYSWFTIGLRGRVVGHEYRLSQAAPLNDMVLKYSQILIGPVFDIAITDHLTLRLEGGAACSRIFEFRDKDSTASVYDGTLEEQVYSSGALIYTY
ncbi:MAG TPA: DUF6268 family outer membrane beta-barrel protein [bacterium]|nr:DUF6268 family outer membrane beta-barrel protein [bacterium]HPJ72241.1 DUF6268 family outer membrane beta-barrel protein [bacterium]HPQ65911.1 DUF6268 family outer membrane beta-barrel protein [bacterium]